MSEELIFEPGSNVFVTIDCVSKECIIIKPIYTSGGVFNYLVETTLHASRFIVPKHLISYDYSDKSKTTADYNNLFSIGDIVCKESNPDDVGIIKAASSIDNHGCGYVVEFMNVGRPAEIWPVDCITIVDECRIMDIASDHVKSGNSGLKIISLDDN